MLVWFWSLVQCFQDKFDPPNYHKAEISGQFYEANAEILKSEVQKLLGDNKPTYRMILVPHASHHYSGAIAAKAFAAIAYPERIQRIVLIGPYHRSPLGGVAISVDKFWETPLGKIDVDRDFVNKLSSRTRVKPNDPGSRKINGSRIAPAGLFRDDPEVGFPKGEHSLEVQLPFIQVRFPNAKIVPIMINEDRYAPPLAQALAPHIDDTTLVVISSDLHHFDPSDENDRKDIQTIHAITNGQPIPEDRACGRVAIMTAMELAKLKNWRVEFIAAANSSAVAPFDKSRVVGYAAAVFYHDPNWLNQEEQKYLLQLARQTLTCHSRESGNPEKCAALLGSRLREDDKMLRSAAVFVTLTDKNGQLMGCIGGFEPELPLHQAVQKKVIEAAYYDSRFDNRDKRPQDFANIAISILSPLVPTRVEDIIAGFHGVRVTAQGSGGTYLPEVAPENNWTKKDMLYSLCGSKAGLRENCFLKSTTRVESYTTQHFSELN